ncbi:MAG: hypothetical protein JW889_05670 [Verrucomicrobia bacterium]|nr:hypothetical protein [Verrucomicrobiota bacterium]
MAEDRVIEINIDGIDTDEIMRQIRARIEAKRAAGVYDRYNLTGITKLEVTEAKSEEDFIRYSLKMLQRTHEIDIADFPIPNKGGPFGWLEVLVKKVLWHLLKFYTWRMWTQQREFNAQVVNTLRALNRKLDTLKRTVDEGDRSEDGPAGT